MFYTIYKVTNVLNNKYYIGKHMTKDLDDGYMGSGKLIRRAIKKHGKENFKKEILHVFDNEEAMNAKEAELVVVSEETYNLCDGGTGGWGYVNRNKLNLYPIEIRRKNGYSSLEKKIGIHALSKNELSYFGKIGTSIQKELESSFYNPNVRKLGLDASLSNESRQKRKQTMLKNNHQVGKKNSQHETCWITNGIENKKIKKNNIIPYGWSRGRIMTSLRTGVIGNTQVSET